MKYKLHKDWCQLTRFGNECDCRSVDIQKVLEDKSKCLEYILQLEDALFQSAEIIAGWNINSHIDFSDVIHLTGIYDNLVPEEPA